MLGILNSGAAILALATPCTFAQDVPQESTPPKPPPPFQKLRYDEDYTYLRDPSASSDFWDPIKYIPLNERGDWYLSLGGEIRERFEFYDNYRWNPNSPDKDGYFLQRYLFHADAHFGESVRVFAQLQSSLEQWRAGGPRPTDEDRLDFNQLFADLRVWADEADNSVTLRVGRQEMMYGSQRLISVREDPNTRRSFDAVRVLTKVGDWKIDGFLAHPVGIDPGIFDDRSQSDINFWGIYASGPLPCLNGASLDAYYLGLRRPDSTYVQGTANEDRHSVGARFFGKSEGFDYNLEGVYQFGSFGSGQIRAWTVASDTGYTFKDADLSPRIGLKIDVISGDGNPQDSSLGTFNPLFPRGSYFGEIGLLGPQNLIDIHPSIELHPCPEVTISADWDIFWRYSTQDGIYDAAGNILRGRVGGSRYIGNQPSLGLQWAPDRHTTFNFVYSHFFPGSYIQQTGPSADVNFVAVWVSYRF